MLTDDQVRIEELEKSVSKLEDTITDLMDIIYDHYKLKDPYGSGDSELFDVIKKFQGE